MSFVTLRMGGKGKGLADQARIDIAKNCNNKCLGCYAKKVSCMGSKFDGDVLEYDYDESKLRSSIKRGVHNGIKYARCGMQCDPGANPDVLLKVAKTSHEEGLQLVIVTKSLPYQREYADQLKNHILHMSLGMKSENAPTGSERLETGLRYLGEGCNVKFRAVEDSTRKPDAEYNWLYNTGRSILLTPMRYPSKVIAEAYGVNLDDYTFAGGYYRPNFVDDDWKYISAGICGEVGSKTLCSNCLI